MIVSYPIRELLLLLALLAPSYLISIDNSLNKPLSFIGRGDPMEYQLKASAYSLTERQIHKLIDNTPKFRDRLILKLLAGCGLRREEVCTIRWADINLDDQVVRIEGKGNKIRMVPFSMGIKNDIFEWISFHLKKSQFMFPAKLKKKSPLAVGRINKIVALAGERAGVINPNANMRNVNPHILRHSFARQMKDRGMSYETLQNILGHASFITTMNTYGTKSLDDIRKDFQEVNFI